MAATKAETLPRGMTGLVATGGSVRCGVCMVGMSGQGTFRLATRNVADFPFRGREAGITLTLRRWDVEGFEDWLAENLAELHAQWRADRGEKPGEGCQLSTSARGRSRGQGQKS